MKGNLDFDMSDADAAAVLTGSPGQTERPTPGPERGMLARGERILTQDVLPGLAPYIRWLRNPLASLTSAAIASMLCGFDSMWY